MLAIFLTYCIICGPVLFIIFFIGMGKLFWGLHGDFFKSIGKALGHWLITDGADRHAEKNCYHFVRLKDPTKEQRKNWAAFNRYSEQEARELLEQRQIYGGWCIKRDSCDYSKRHECLYGHIETKKQLLAALEREQRNTDTRPRDHKERNIITCLHGDVIKECEEWSDSIKPPVKGRKIVYALSNKDSKPNNAC